VAHHNEQAPPDEDAPKVTFYVGQVLEGEDARQTDE
jgi:hypothetical protein